MMSQPLPNGPVTRCVIIDLNEGQTIKPNHVGCQVVFDNQGLAVLKCKEVAVCRKCGEPLDQALDKGDVHSKCISINYLDSL